MSIGIALRFWLPLFAICLFAFARGGSPERRVSGLLLLAGITTLLVREVLLMLAVRLTYIDWVTAGIDAVLLVALFAIALRALRLWPIFLTATQAVTLLGHVAGWLMPWLSRLGYDILTIAPAYLGLIALLIGTVTHQHRLRRYGADASWRPRSQQPGSTKEMR